jgi:hypothetical protein
MNRIKTRKNRNLITTVYTDEAAGSIESAVRLLIRFRDLDGFEAKYAALRDLDHSADEGNHSREIRTNADESEILNMLASHPCGKLYLGGTYRDIRAGIGIQMKTGEVLITLPGEHADLAEEMVRRM